MKPLLLPLMFLFCWAISAQQPAPLKPIKLIDFVNRKPDNCESRSAVVDVLTQSVPADDTIIVIAHLGRLETKPNLNWRRLQNLRTYWTQGVAPEARRKPETIVLAEGERVEGYGRLEFYVAGKLVWLINLRRNADFDVTDCVPPDDSYIRNRVYDPCWLRSHRIYYPCRDRYAKRKGDGG